LKKTDKDRKKKERMKVKLMATSDPELKASLRRKKAEEMKRYRQRKKLKAMTPVPCIVVLYHKVQKSKAAPSIQKKKEAVKRTQAWRMCIKLSKSQTMPNTLHENDSHEENRTNEDNISRESILKWKQLIMNGTRCPEENLYSLKM
jgi:hypothetical protein